MKRLMMTALPCLVLVACNGANSDDLTYDPTLLEQYRQVIPSASLLEASYPEASTVSKQLAEVGDPAMFPQQAVPIAQNINHMIESMLETLENVVEYPPTAYNSETLEFVWGPMENDDSEIEGDTVYVYIRDQGEAADFRYSYAFLRGMGNDVSTMAPVIWGGHNPDPSGQLYGDGACLWDFEANYDFVQENGSGIGDETRGRFAAVFAQEAVDAASERIVTWVVASFRDFVPDDAAEDTDPTELDYLWGKVEEPEQRFDFLDLEYPANLEGTSTSEPEDFGMRLAFYNTGVGLAEADATGGDLPTDMPGYYAEATECWDAALARTYLSIQGVPDDPDSTDPIYTFETEGEAADCAMSNLDEVPSLDDVDPNLLAALDDLANNGL